MVTDTFVPSVRPFIDHAFTRQPDRRRSPRIVGPFDGRRMGAIARAIRVYELNVGGCLIACDDAIAIGRRIDLQIDLAGEGWISVEAETLYPREHFGFAVTFVDVSDANRARIERTIDRVLAEQADAAWTLGTELM
jgi:hypothetical protein